MRTRLRGVVFLGLTGLTAASLTGACGTRTGLPADQLLPIEQPDVLGDAPGDATREVGRDATHDTTLDVPEEDVLPPIDSRPRDVRRDDCPDADATLIYLVSASDDLLSFYPPTMTFKTIGKIACPGGDSPYSMAVDRKGKAYVIFLDGRLFQVSTATAACIATTFAPDQQGFHTFGMGFVSNVGGPDETLFVAEGTAGGAGASRGLASIDVTSFKLNFIAPFTPPQSRVEFTGTGDGRLFGFSPSNGNSHILEVDKTNGNIVASDIVNAGGTQDAFAFAYWGGDFWIFTGQAGTTVYRYRPSDKTTTMMGTAPALIVGAGVSTCAPQ